MALVLSCLRTTSCRTRATLATTTGLSRATVSSLIDELISLNLVRETGIQISQGGRPGTCLELNPKGGAAIGLEVGVDFISVVLTDFVANILWKNRVEFDTREQPTVIALAEQQIERAIQYSRELRLKLLGIGVGLPGLVKVNEGTLTFAPNLGWQNVPFQTPWERRFGIPVYVINEGSAAALGEHYFGVAAGYHDFIYLSASTVGIGAGIVIGGKLFQGIQGYAGEIGHMVLEPSGPLCACGRHGCWEKVAGAQTILKYVEAQAATGHISKALKPGQKLTTDIVAQAAQEGDSIAHEAIEQIIPLFGVGVINLLNTFNPQLFVIGGALSRALTPFLREIEAEVNQQAFRALADTVAIKISRLGDDACLMGAVAAVLDVVLANPTQRIEVGVA